MKNKTYDEARLIRYLLGQVSADQQAQIENEYFADPEFQDELLAVERDLIDRYVRGDLSQPEQFEKAFLSSPTRVRKVEFARSLMQSLDSVPVRAEQPLKRAWFGRGVSAWAYAAVAAVVLIGVFLLVQRRAQPAFPAAVTAPAPTNPNSLPTPAAPAEPVNAPPVVRMATLVLTPSLTRDAGETPALKIEGQTDVRIELQLETVDYASYSALIRTAEGREVWKQNQLKPERGGGGRAVVVQVPANRLSEDDYTIKLSAGGIGDNAEEVAGYAFKVRRN